MVLGMGGRPVGCRRCVITSYSIHYTKLYDFWQDHRLIFLEMAFRTDRRERLDKPDGYAKNTGDCGDTVEFFVTLNGEALIERMLDSQPLSTALLIV